MKKYKQKTWQFEVSGVEGDVKLFGVNIFDYEWERTGKKVIVKDPLYIQELVFHVYKVMIDEQEYEFASGEFSNCVYGIYLEKY